jgi:hypothetical protein
MRRWRALWNLAASSAIGCLAPTVAVWLHIDACLDRGGVWDHDRGECRWDVLQMPGRSVGLLMPDETSAYVAGLAAVVLVVIAVILDRLARSRPTEALAGGPTRSR